jgi:aldehyde:ferredoxin oxidoreductase
VEIRDASHFWGRDLWATTAGIRKELGDNAFQVAAIGPAGENLVKFATVACNNNRICGRTGMGCLFGFKNLKAVAVRGTTPVSVADTLTYLDLCREVDRRILEHPEWDRRHAMGSTLLMKALNEIGILPTNHFQKGICDYVDKISGETIGWAMECFEKGLLNRDDVEGLDFTWGNKETVEKILNFMVRREAIGDAFAEGTRSLARRFGRGAEKYALQVKDLDIICGDPRGIKAFRLTYAIASRGADHLRAEPFFELTERYDEAERRWGIWDIADRLSNNGKAVLVEHTERQALITECMTMCKNIGLSMDIMDFGFASRLLTAGTGLLFSEERVDKSLRGVIDSERKMNIDFGIDSSMDALPHRFTCEPLKEGPSKGEVVPVRDMVREYYKLRGWDEEGRPNVQYSP